MTHVEPCVVESGPQPTRGDMAGGARRREPRRHVIRIGCSGVVRLVASVAIRRQGRVIVVHVATRACHRGMRARQRERRVVVVKRRRRPGCGAVAHVALLRQTCRHVVRIGRPLEVLHVATHARRAGQAVVAAQVALAALQTGVPTGQGPARARMIEGRARPGRRAVADLALLWESCCHVVRIGRPLEILQVTTHTSGVADVVIAVQVALRALHLGVSPSQRKCRLRMIERRRHPGHRGMAKVALLGHASRNVVRIGRPLVILQVARDARCARQVEVPVGVALIALQLRVSTRQRESHRIMIEVRRLPGRGGMALLAGLRDAQRDVVGIARSLVVRQVAAYAGRRRSRVLPAHMASHTVEGRVHPS